MHIIITFVFFIYGIVFGSFFNVVGLRVPTKSLFSQSRSYCDTCQRTLTWRELIPIWSFIRQRGKCRHCKKIISPLYPIIELATGVLVAYTFYRYGWNQELILGLLLISMIIPLTVSDLVYRRIPNHLLLFFLPFFVVYRIINPLPSFWDSLLGAVVAFTLLFLIIILSKGGMGAGDLKYFTLLGFIFGAFPFLLLFFLSTFYGTISGVFLMMSKKVDRKAAIPFGPYIGLAALTVFYFGEWMIQWYLLFLN